MHLHQLQPSLIQLHSMHKYQVTSCDTHPRGYGNSILVPALVEFYEVGPMIASNRLELIHAGMQRMHNVRPRS
jgi:hypothetical protein